MPEKIPVYDGGGRKIGDFIPEGAGLEVVIAMLLGGIVIVAIVYVIYSFYRLFAYIVERVKAGDEEVRNRVTALIIIALFISLAMLLSTH